MQSEQKWTGTHTPEPWVVFNDGTAVGACRGITTLHPIVMDVAPEDAHRIVACVNACAGLSDPAAELAQLRLDCKALAAEVRLRRAVPESSTAELLKAMDAVDASGALTRHTGDGT